MSSFLRIHCLQIHTLVSSVSKQNGPSAAKGKIYVEKLQLSLSIYFHGCISREKSLYFLSLSFSFTRNLFFVVSVGSVCTCSFNFHKCHQVLLFIGSKGLQFSRRKIDTTFVMELRHEMDIFERD